MPQSETELDARTIKLFRLFFTWLDIRGFRKGDYGWNAKNENMNYTDEQLVLIFARETGLYDTNADYHGIEKPQRGDELRDELYKAWVAGATCYTSHPLGFAYQVGFDEWFTKHYSREIAVDIKRAKAILLGFDEYCEAHDIGYYNECPECAKLKH